MSVKSNQKPLLISIEGIDGSGKTSLVEKLKQAIPNSVATQSPRGTILGQKIWDLVTENLVSRKLITNVWTEFFLFTANHNEHALTVIKPNLAVGKTVLIDRYIDSTLIYQGIRGKLPLTKLVEVWKNTIDIPFPDLTFVLDIEPKKAAERVNRRRQETGEEPNNWDNSKLEFHQVIRNGYLELKEYFPQRIRIINAERSETEILAEIQTIIKKILPYKKIEKNNLPNFVRVIIQNEKGELLTIFEKKWNCWVFPGGKIEANETPLEAAKREVFEETNLIIEDLKIVAEQDFDTKNQGRMGYLVKANKYSGEIKIKEVGKILEIKFKQIDYEFAVNRLFFAIKF
jgi:dTMP kinase